MSSLRAAAVRAERVDLSASAVSLCAKLGATVIDLFFAEYLNPSDDLTVIFGESGPIETLCRWRDDGAVRYVGASTHDASVAARCIEDGRVDVLMLRCNMAHRRLRAAVFPKAQRAGVSVVAFTATRWGTLLEGHPDWSEVPPTALDCYRYCLAQPGVEVVLSAATTLWTASRETHVADRTRS